MGRVLADGTGYFDPPLHRYETTKMPPLDRLPGGSLALRYLEKGRQHSPASERILSCPLLLFLVWGLLLLPTQLLVLVLLFGLSLLLAAHF